jgi:hypothetical protein
VVPMCLGIDHSSKASCHSVLHHTRQYILHLLHLLTWGLYMHCLLMVIPSSSSSMTKKVSCVPSSFQGETSSSMGLRLVDGPLLRTRKQSTMIDRRTLYFYMSLYHHTLFRVLKKQNESFLDSHGVAVVVVVVMCACHIFVILLMDKKKVCSKYVSGES